MTSKQSQYHSLKTQQFDLDRYTLVPLRHQDIQKIKDWRNDQMIVLRQKTKISAADQESYYQKTILKSFSELKPDLILFSFLQDAKCIGYGGLVWIDWNLKQAEVSFLVSLERSLNEDLYREDFSHFLRLLKQVAFYDLQLDRLYTETYDIRTLHISILENEGFLLEKRLKEHVKKDEKTMDALIHGCKK